MDIFEFLKETEGHENALEFAIKHELFPNKERRKCLKCGRENTLRWCRNSRNLMLPYMFVCASYDCRLTISSSRNTLFERLNFPLSCALRLIYFWLLKIPYNESSDQLQIPEATVVEWYQHFQEICAYVVINYTEPIGGEGRTVELKEYCLQGHEVSRYNVFIYSGIDRHTGKYFAIHVTTLKTFNLWPYIKCYILPGTTVVTTKNKEFTMKESKSKNPYLTFVHPKDNPRTYSHRNFDGIWSELKKFVEKEIYPEKEVLGKELYAYQFLYFYRVGFRNKPVSELIIPFLKDVKRVYPGYERDLNIEINRKKSTKKSDSKSDK